MIYFPMSSFTSAKASVKEVIFSIEKGEGSRDISLNLEKEGLIKWAPIFRLYVLTIGVSGRLQAGTYVLSSSMNMPKIAEKLAKGDVIKTEVTIPEGFTLSEIEMELTSEFKEQNLNPQLKSKSLNLYKKDYDFLADAPDVAGLEGYLFPDTYWFSYGAEEEDIIKAMLDNFSKKLNLALRGEIKNQKKTIFEIITMASLLEKEVKTIEDKKLVSGILWKRLKIGMPLQVDATIGYIIGKNSADISSEETKIDSPYNTYKYKGLPLGPISNPGLESIMAAVYPSNSPYFYYLSAPDGKTIFSKTLQEHNLAKAKYLKP